MYNNIQEGEGGYRTITPSARRGIHENNHPILANAGTMKINSKSTSIDAGTDEIDNVLSKQQRPLSPTTTQKCTKTKRILPTGFAVDEELTDESDNSESISSKSCLPEVSSLSSNCRNKNSFHQNNVLSSLNTSNNNISNVSVPENQPSHDGSELIGEGAKYKTSDRDVTNTILYALLSLAIPFLCISYYQYQGAEKTIQHKYDKLDFYQDVKSLTNNFKVKQHSLLQVRTGINAIYEKEDTGSFIFTYDESVNGFDPVTFNNFMNNIAATASKYLRNNTKNTQHVVLDNSKIIRLKSDSDLIHEFHESIDKNGILLVENVEKIPSDLAMAFHYYCDEYNPLVKKSAIFFTLNVAKCSVPSNQKSMHDYIERCLKAKWKDIESDKIGPLLTRVVNIIVDVTYI